jgi:hypothetical protein
MRMNCFWNGYTLIPGHWVEMEDEANLATNMFY